MRVGVGGLLWLLCGSPFFFLHFISFVVIGASPLFPRGGGGGFLFFWSLLFFLFCRALHTPFSSYYNYHLRLRGTCFSLPLLPLPLPLLGTTYYFYQGFCACTAFIFVPRCQRGSAVVIGLDEKMDGEAGKGAAFHG
ncbi:hypothetical protein BKA81DRAFT_42129 [Phyllosticta paracitricarpa]